MVPRATLRAFYKKIFPVVFPQMILKIRFKCESCDEFCTVDAEGHNMRFGQFLAYIQKQGWKVVSDLRGSETYCPACEPKDWA